LVVGAFFVLCGVFLFKKEGNFSDSKYFGKWIGKPLPNGKIWDSEENQIDFLSLFSQQKTGNQNKKMVVSMWATWCEPCIEELNDLKNSKTELQRQGIEVVLLNYDGGIPQKTIPEVKAWLVAQGLELKTYFDFNEYFLKEVEIYSLPFSIGAELGFDSQGKVQTKIAWLKNRAVNWDRLGF
jgi:thiol-disulfide isomerase/thioredoxin